VRDEKREKRIEEIRIVKKREMEKKWK